MTDETKFWDAVCLVIRDRLPAMRALCKSFHGAHTRHGMHSNDDTLWAWRDADGRLRTSVVSGRVGLWGPARQHIHDVNAQDVDAVANVLCMEYLRINAEG